MLAWARIASRASALPTAIGTQVGYSAGWVASKVGGRRLTPVVRTSATDLLSLPVPDVLVPTQRSHPRTTSSSLPCSPVLCAHAHWSNLRSFFVCTGHFQTDPAQLQRERWPRRHRSSQALCDPLDTTATHAPLPLRRDRDSAALPRCASTCPLAPRQSGLTPC
jgi:hypothetical protein